MLFADGEEEEYFQLYQLRLHADQPVRIEI